MNVNLFSQQLELMQVRLDKLYKTVSVSVLQPEILPTAFKELGMASEELQIAVEELQQQNEELLAAQVIIEAQRQRYKQLFEFAPDGYLVTDTAGLIQEANHAASKMLNVSQRFLVGKPLIIFVAEEDRHKTISQLNQMQQAQQKQDWLLRLCPREAESFEAALSINAIHTCEGKVAGLHICVRENSSATRGNRLRQYTKAESEKNNYEFIQDCQKHVYLKGEIIPLQPQTVWQVCQGIVRLSTMTENGEEVLLGLAGPSMPFGTHLTSLQTYQATALSNVEVVSFSLTDVLASPQLVQMILPQINIRLRQTEALLAISGKRLVKDRLHHLFLLLKQEIGQPVEQGTRLSVRLTHQDLADACSTTRVTITRLLGKLQAEGKIILDARNHIILKELYQSSC